MLTRAGKRAFSTDALKVVNNVARQQFTTSLQGVEATLSYEASGKKITYNSTDVPPEFQGKGIGKLLAQHALDHARDNKLDVIIKCHFLANYYENNLNEYKNLKIKIQTE